MMCRHKVSIGNHWLLPRNLLDFIDFLLRIVLDILAIFSVLWRRYFFLRSTGLLLSVVHFICYYCLFRERQAAGTSLKWETEGTLFFDSFIDIFRNIIFLFGLMGVMMLRWSTSLLHYRWRIVPLMNPSNCIRFL
jgi:hypothetical protein